MRGKKSIIDAEAARYVRENYGRLTIAQCAAKMGMSVQTFSRYRKELGLPSDRKPRVADRERMEARLLRLREAITRRAAIGQTATHESAPSPWTGNRFYNASCAEAVREIFGKLGMRVRTIADAFDAAMAFNFYARMLTWKGEGQSVRVFEYKISTPEDRCIGPTDSKLYETFAECANDCALRMARLILAIKQPKQ